MKNHLEQLKEYLLSDSSEKAIDHLAFPLFKKIFGKKAFRKETDAEGLDIYIEAQLGVELKTEPEEWLSGFYQVLHYQKKGMNFSAVCVITHKFIGLWKLSSIPQFVLDLAEKANAQKAANEVGRINARKTSKGQKTEIIKSATYCLRTDDFEGLFKGDINYRIAEFADLLKNLDSVRLQINPQNFIQKIELLKAFFDDPMEAIHCFYTIIKFWDITSIVADPTPSKPALLDVQSGRRRSEEFFVNPRHHFEFRKFVENHYIFTNEGSGLTVDYYFSRFDEVITRLKPEYTKQHGVFFTDHNLSKFALWFEHHYFEKKLSEKYIVLDPAGGSGNLVTSWRNHLKHKIVSEINPDLLKIIERRMKADEDQIKIGFTIVPKTTLGEGLNFLDKTADEYLTHIRNELKENNLRLDKPIAFLLNPPYKSTDENERYRKATGADYVIDESILELTGKDAGKERYLAFLGQILNICKLQVGENPDFKPLIMIFTPTSWLIPRPTYVPFRREFDRHFKFEKGFMVTSREFFKIGGKWPLTFTIWSYNYKKSGNKNVIRLKDYTNLQQDDLSLNWQNPLNEINKAVQRIVRGSKTIKFTQDRTTIKQWCGQKMYDFKRSRTKAELQLEVVGGLPLEDPRRKNKKTYGITNSRYIGFMDNGTPVRIKPKEDGRFSTNHEERVWFRLDNDIKGINRTRLLNGPPDNRGYCAYDLDSAKKLFTWFALTKALNVHGYPLWANQYDIWMPNITDKLERYFHSLCFAFGLAENNCVVTKFEADNPVKGAPEIFVDNPLCSTNPDSFWSRALDSQVVKRPKLARVLVDSVSKLYEVWKTKYCVSGKVEYVGLDEEPYFKYFDYPDFITPYSGLVQIKKFAEVKRADDLDEQIKEINERKKKILDEIYRILIEEFKYFE
ncbi:hypothetical protein KAU45_07760 [bacterium]|nr:hypothetical protein [bacterium]